MVTGFSIVIPLYNKAHTIESTLQSVLAQDYVEFEIIVVDDGSSDEGPALVHGISDPRIRVLHQEHNGAGAARNAGIKEARFDLIAFLDADDLLLPRYLSVMKEVVDAFPDAGMYCSAGVTDYPDGPNIVRRSRRYRRVSEVNFFDNPPLFGNSSSTIVRKSEIHRTDGFPIDMHYNEDLVFFYTLALQVKVVFCPELLTIYRQGVPGQTSADRPSCYRAIAARSLMLYPFWNRLGADLKNQKFKAAMLRDLRQGLLYFLANRDSGSVSYLLTESDPELIAQLKPIERFLFPRPAWRPLSILSLLLAQFFFDPQPRRGGRLRRVLPARRAGPATALRMSLAQVGRE